MLLKIPVFQRGCKINNNNAKKQIAAVEKRFNMRHYVPVRVRHFGFCGTCLLTLNDSSTI